jgi:hypothetical protein
MNAPCLLDKLGRATAGYRKDARAGAIIFEVGVVLELDDASDQLAAFGGVNRRIIVELDGLIRKIDGAGKVQNRIVAE